MQTAGNTYTKRGARALAHTIQRYWTGRGYFAIAAEAVPIEGTGLFGIGSNIGPDGFPPREK